MAGFKRQMEKRMQSKGQCLKLKEFTKPKRGLIVQKFDELGPDFRMNFEIKLTIQKRDIT